MASFFLCCCVCPLGLKPAATGIVLHHHEGAIHVEGTNYLLWGINYPNGLFIFISLDHHCRISIICSALWYLRWKINSSGSKTRYGGSLGGGGEMRKLASEAFKYQNITNRNAKVTIVVFHLSHRERVLNITTSTLIKFSLPSFPRNGSCHQHRPQL